MSPPITGNGVEQPKDAAGLNGNGVEDIHSPAALEIMPAVHAASESQATGSAKSGSSAQEHSPQADVTADVPLVCSSRSLVLPSASSASVLCRHGPVVVFRAMQLKYCAALQTCYCSYEPQHDAVCDAGSRHMRH